MESIRDNKDSKGLQGNVIKGQKQPKRVNFKGNTRPDNLFSRLWQGLKVSSNLKPDMSDYLLDV